MKKKILYIATAIKGGEWKHIQDLSLAFKDDFDIHVISCTKPILNTSIPFYSFSFLSFFRFVFFLKRSNFDLIHAHGFRALTFIRIFNLFYSSCPPIIGTIHGFSISFFSNTFKRMFRILLERLLYKIQDFTIYVSSSDLYLAKKNACYIANKSLLIHNAVDIPDLPSLNYQALLSQYSFSDKPGFISIFSGALEAHKNPILLLDALIYLKKSSSLHDIFLFFLGVGPLEASLRQKINDNGLQKQVFLCGYQDNVLDWLAHADLLVFPSSGEGLPYTVLEAMSVACPVLAMDVPGCNELIEDEKTGRLLSSHSVETLAEAILESYKNPNRSGEYAVFARKLVLNKYSLEKMLLETKALYQRFLI